MRGACWALSGAILLAASSSVAESPSKVECVAANEAGQFLVQSGKLLEAERMLATCMAASCPLPVREDCAQRLIQTGRAIPSIAFEVKDSAGQGVRAARVTVDGQASPDALDGKRLRLDAGEHRFLFEAVGLSPTEKTFMLRAGDQARRETIVLAAAPAAAAPAAAAPAAVRVAPVPVAEDGHRGGQVSGAGDARPSPRATLPALAFVAAGVGVAGLALGIGAGIAASSKNMALEGECSGRVCPPSALPDINSFRTGRDWSTAGYVLGAAGLATGAILWLAAPRSTTNAPAAGLWIGPRTAGVAGRF